MQDYLYCSHNSCRYEMNYYRFFCFICSAFASTITSMNFQSNHHNKLQVHTIKLIGVVSRYRWGYTNQGKQLVNLFSFLYDTKSVLNSNFCYIFTRVAHLKTKFCFALICIKKKVIICKTNNQQSSFLEPDYSKVALVWILTCF